MSNARVKFAAENHHPALCELLKSAGADINAVTYGGPTHLGRLALSYPQKAIKTDVVLSTPMLLTFGPRVTSAKHSDFWDTSRLLMDSMDFLNETNSGWFVLSLLINDADGRSAKNEAEPALLEAKLAFLLWMLKLFTDEMRAYYTRSRIVYLLIGTLNPHSGLEPVSNLLLKLRDVDVIDVTLNGTDGYALLHHRLAHPWGREWVSSVLAIGPNLHLQGFNENYTPEKESPTSLAMYSLRAFADWLRGLVGIEFDLSTFIDQELASNAFVHPGWDKETLRYLFDYPLRPDLDFGNPWDCSDCGDSRLGIWVQPYWRHLLERIKQRIDPDDPFRSDPGVDETQISNIRSGMEASNDSDHEPGISGSVSLDEFKDDVRSEAKFESESEVELGSDVHGYPENVPIQSECMYGPNETVCMDCWLHYRRTGTRFKVEDSPIDEHPSSEDESSDDEFSPYHIHS